MGACISCDVKHDSNEIIAKPMVPYTSPYSSTKTPCELKCEENAQEMLGKMPSAPTITI
jgi:hypothetical protein